MLFAAAFAVRPLPRADGPLEPSIQNEVDHALDPPPRKRPLPPSTSPFMSSTSRTTNSPSSRIPPTASAAR